MPLQVEFNAAALDLGPLIKGVDPLDADPNTAGHQGTNEVVITGDVTAYGPGQQSFSVPAAGFAFPVWSTTTAGQNLTVDVIMDQTLNGTYNFDNGALSTSAANFRAVITTQDADVDNDPMTVDPGIVNECEIGVTDGTVSGSGPLPLTFSTENTPTPPAGAFLGERFTPPFPPGIGAVTSLWSDLPQAVPTDATPEAGENCALVQGIQHGAGGLWLGANEPDPGSATRFSRQPTPPATAPPAAPGDNRNVAAYKVCLKKAKKIKKKSKKKKAIKKCKAKFGF